MLTDLLNLVLNLADHLLEGVHVDAHGLVHLALAHHAHAHHHHVGVVLLAALLAALLTTLFASFLGTLISTLLRSREINGERRGNGGSRVRSRNVLLGLHLLRVLGLLLHGGREGSAEEADKTESLELHGESCGFLNEVVNWARSGSRCVWLMVASRGVPLKVRCPLLYT